MKQYLAFITIALLAIGTTSCHKKVLRGEGPTITETRFVGEFSKIEANGSARVVVVEDDDYSVIVTGYGNLIPMYETKVNGDRLVLQYKDRFWNVRNDNITVEVHTPFVDKVSLNGSGNISIGSGFDQTRLMTDINGSGNIYVSGSKYNSVSADINGSGTFDSENSDVNNVYISISGSGDAYVSVNEYLKVNINGSGDVYYRGDPGRVETSISGSGKVHKRN